jgi:hypothetical protein
MNNNLLKASVLEFESMPSAMLGLKYGAKGSVVKTVQQWLNIHAANMRLPQIAMDGDFGHGTEKALKDFCSRRSMLYVDEINHQIAMSLVAPLASAFNVANLVQLLTQDVDKSFAKHYVNVANYHLNMGAREVGKNEGPWVRAYMDGNEGSEWAWCAGFVLTTLYLAALSYQAVQHPAAKQIMEKIQAIPRTFSCDVLMTYFAQSGAFKYFTPDLLNSGKIGKGDIFFVLNPTNKKDAIHVGLLSNASMETAVADTLEGNTNNDGSRDGVGVFARYRKLTQNIGIVDLQSYLQGMKL